MSYSPSITFHGAAGAVTGSCFLIEYGDERVLIDCGLFQGSKTEKELNYRPFPFAPARLNAVILTHAHIDHTGLVPKLVKDGYDGPIFCTAATRDLCTVMLPDSGHIQEMEVEQLNRRNEHRGRKLVTPIYTAMDASSALTQFRAHPIKQWMVISPAFRFRFWNAGHLLGSASVEIEVGNGPEQQRLLFSGDIGPQHKLFHSRPEGPAGLDYLVCESTYGDVDRNDPSAEQRRRMLKDEVQLAARHQSGVLLIPSFAVERTQELLADLVSLLDAGAITRCPIIIDSPLATRATEVFSRHARELENGELLLRALRSRQIRFTETAEQSRSIDNLKGFHIVIAASGMCEAGRIRHRLKNWLWRPEATVLLVGYQASGTLGRILEDGASAVRIQGDEIVVRASIRKLDVYSGHADAPELAAWVAARVPVKHAIFLVHGERPAISGLNARLAAMNPSFAIIEPDLDTTYSLTGTGAILLSAKQELPRLQPIRVGRGDWHNDFQSLVMDLQDRLDKAADEKQRSVILRKIRRTLEETGP
ncbi:MBL fold metallo-hydrolase [Agrobacterium tumefaciens]|uniref:MBL fold metallo-hydrolase n=1 Tax=Agrobacterium tumefaciens TaxID=358 RepID=UPI00277D8F6C|nr:MBL fold metallo-hydrolase [Agrobacterium tumefaciens]MDP9857566.1 metallo-beta-lactamase family protein [Agrobacterium tumefaciens]